MLVYCIECEKKVSDKALSCPACGFIFSKNIKEKEKLFKKKAEEILKRVRKLKAKERALDKKAQDDLQKAINDVAEGQKLQKKKGGGF